MAIGDLISDITGINPGESLSKQLENFGRELITADNLRDRQHGARLFADNNYELLPKQSYLFHIFVELVDPDQFQSDRKLELNLLAKAATLPSFMFDTQTLNSYNRKVNIQKRVNYDPISITFHDDSANVVQEFYRKYYQHYFRDGDHQLSQYDNQNIYGFRTTDAWGYDPLYNIAGRDDEPSRQGNFLRSIRIYSLQGKKASEYILINPMITRWRNASHQAGSNEFIDSEMTVSYEAVKYNENLRNNLVTAESVKGFGVERYDRAPSPLRTLGATKSIFGPAGLVDSITGIGSDLGSGTGGGLVRAALSSARTFNTFKNGNLKETLVSNLRDSVQDVVTGGAKTLASGRYRFPSIPGVGNRSNTAARE